MSELYKQAEPSALGNLREEAFTAGFNEGVFEERQRCAQAIQDWRHKLDNRTEQLEGWVAEELYYAVLGRQMSESSA